DPGFPGARTGRRVVGVRAHGPAGARVPARAVSLHRWVVGARRHRSEGAGRGRGPAPEPARRSADTTGSAWPRPDGRRLIPFHPVQLKVASLPVDTVRTHANAVRGSLSSCVPQWTPH